MQEEACSAIAERGFPGFCPLNSINAYLNPVVGLCRVGQGKDRAKVESGLPMMDITCETDIFRALGLSYVPPHLRMP